MNKLKKIDIDYNLIYRFKDESKFYVPETKEMIYYWTDGKRVYWMTNIIKNADIESFVIFNNRFAKDKKHCYLNSTALKNSNPEYFNALNICFAKDDKNAWTISGIIKDIDAKTFEVCDDGICKPTSAYEVEFKDKSKGVIKFERSYGYAKDKNNVYYENFQGKPKIVRKANPSSFKSLNTGYFGIDDKFVFFEQYVIKKADINSWHILDVSKNQLYSKDNKFVFYGNKIIKEADAETFELYSHKTKDGYTNYYGKDKNNYYQGLDIIDFKEIK